ncbi:MAG TPA: lysophospholipid acyltransferase family protein [Candidatus Sulfopaludibacter sp.]|jgi:KDO2-lipid IV(A) lauroyltransferase|nr:lysophospholipid acyltransferase family protein [Candidatus Sulfopaludibacter sp.]
MRHRSPVRNRAEYCLALSVLKVLEWLPSVLAHRMARWAVRLFLDWPVPKLRRTAERNLSMALPELNAAQRRRTIDAVFASVARTIVTFARFPRINRGNVAQWIRCEGGEYFTAALERGRGVLFATAHLGNWELSAFAHGLITGPMNVLVRPLDNPLIDAMVERRRGLSGNRIIAKQDFARPILKALAANEAVGILIDQNASLDGGVFVDFFGVPACAGAGFAKIAARSGAAVIPGFALWSEEEQRYVLRFYPPVEMTGDSTVDTQTLQSRLEQVIRSYPDQWLWLHRRWKTRPPGEPSLYAPSPEATSGV